MAPPFRRAADQRGQSAQLRSALAVAPLQRILAVLVEPLHAPAQQRWPAAGAAASDRLTASVTCQQPAPAATAAQPAPMDASPACPRSDTPAGGSGDGTPRPHGGDDKLAVPPASEEQVDVEALYGPLPPYQGSPRIFRPGESSRPPVPTRQPGQQAPPPGQQAAAPHAAPAAASAPPPPAPAPKPQAAPPPRQQPQQPRWGAPAGTAAGGGSSAGPPPPAAPQSSCKFRPGEHVFSHEQLKSAAAAAGDCRGWRCCAPAAACRRWGLLEGSPAALPTAMPPTQ